MDYTINDKMDYTINEYSWICRKMKSYNMQHSTGFSSAYNDNNKT